MNIAKKSTKFLKMYFCGGYADIKPSDLIVKTQLFPIRSTFYFNIS